MQSQQNKISQSTHSLRVPFICHVYLFAKVASIQVMALITIPPTPSGKVM